MSNKTNPLLNKIVITKNWKSKWYSTNNIKTLIYTDILIRQLITNTTHIKPEDIFIERMEKTTIINIISNKLNHLNSLTTKIKKITNTNCFINTINNNKVYTIEKITHILKKLIKTRQNYKQAIKQLTNKANYSNITGIKIIIKGRINGVEIAKKEHFTIGNVSFIKLNTHPLYKQTTVKTPYGTIGIKILIPINDTQIHKN